MAFSLVRLSGRTHVRRDARCSAFTPYRSMCQGYSIRIETSCELLGVRRNGSAVMYGQSRRTSISSFVRLSICLLVMRTQPTYCVHVSRPDGLSVIESPLLNRANGSCHATTVLCYRLRFIKSISSDRYRPRCITGKRQCTKTDVLYRRRAS